MAEEKYKSSLNEVLDENYFSEEKEVNHAQFESH